MPRFATAAVLFTLLGAAAPAQSLREASADVPGAHIFYLDSGGTGIPVVFLHANTGSSRVWEYQIPAFTAAGYRVIAFDRRGWGRTTVDPNAQPSTAADDLLALLDHLGLTQVHLIGTAAGGFVALDFALSYPQRLRSLVFANSIGGVEDKDFVDLGRRIRPPQVDALPPEVRELGPSYRAGNAEGTQRWMDLEKISRPAGPRAPAQPLKNHITLRHPRNHQDSHPAAHRRSGYVCAHARAASFCRALQERGNRDRSRCRPLHLLGGAREIQPRRSGFSKKTLRRQ